MKMLLPIIFISFFISCDKDEITTTTFENQTEKSLDITYFKTSNNFERTLKLEPNSIEELVAFNNNLGKTDPSLASIADSCIILFENQKKLTYTRGNSPTEKSILDVDSYDYSFESTYKADLYNYRYFITQEHLDKAE